MSTNQPTIITSLRQMAGSMIAGYRDAWPWIVVGIALALAQILVYEIFGNRVATALHIDKLLGYYSGVDGAALSVSLAIGTMLWALHAMTLWSPVERTANWVTKWITTLSMTATALYSGVAVVAFCSWLRGDRGDQQLLGAITLVVVVLVATNILVACVRGFAGEGEQLRRLIGAVMLVGMLAASLSILLPRVHQYLRERPQQTPMSPCQPTNKPARAMATPTGQRR